MNEVKPTTVAVIPSGSASAQTNSGGAAKSAAPSGKELPPEKAPVAQQQAQATVDPQALDEQQKKVDEAVSKLNDYVQSTQRDLQFSYDEDAGRPVVTVLDRETQQVIRRIPDDVVLNLARNLNDEEPVRLFSAQA